MDRQLKKNVMSLTLLQIGNYLIPLVVLPYLTRVLGADGFGQMGFATAFTTYFVLLVEWGFNLSSTRDVSVWRDDRITRSRVFWETVAARFLLTVAAIVSLLVLVRMVPKLEHHSTLLWLGMLQVLASTLSAAFYYQGIEKMGAMALVNLGVRLSSIPLIIFLVQRPGDVVLAFLIQTSCFLVASLANLLLLLDSNEISWALPRWDGVKRKLIEAFPLFLSSAGTSLYTNSNAVILGFVASEAAVGYFVAGFTLVKAVVGLSGPFAQAVFPRVSQVLSEDGEVSQLFIRKMVRLQAFLGLALSTALLVFLPWGVTWFYGEAFQATVPVVAWLSPLPLIVCLASVFGMQTLVPLGKSRWFASVLLLSGILNCLLLFVLGYTLGASGAAIGVLLTECAIMLGMAIGLKRLAPSIWRSIVACP